MLLCLFKWFSDNYLEANPDKCHLFIINESSKKEVEIADYVTESSKCKNPLG